MSGGPVPLPAWEQLAEAIPGIAAPMRRYLQQIGCVVRGRRHNRAGPCPPQHARP